MNLFFCVFCWWHRSPLMLCLSWPFTGCRSFSNMSQQYDLKDKHFHHVASARIYSLQSRKSLYFRNKTFMYSFTWPVTPLSVFFLVLDMSSVKLSRTRRLATLLSCLLWDFRMIEVLLVIFMSPYLVHLPPLFMGALRNVSGNLCVTFLQVCLFLNEWQTSWCLEQPRQSSLKPEGRNQGCTQA